MNRRNILKLLTGAGLARIAGASSYAQGSRSVQFLFNQLGFLVKQPKWVTVLGANDATHITLHRASGELLRTLPLSPARLDDASGDQVRLADLSAALSHGDFKIELNGSFSDTVHVDRNAYHAALVTTMRAFYGQRCGCAVDLGHGYTHAACHANGSYHPSSGKSGPIPNTGGWHDAGDYGRYIVNSGITCGTLLWAWEMFPDVLHKLNLNLPPGGPACPDFLREVEWNLRWMLSLQDTDGGVFHKQTSEHFCAFIMPEQDTLPSQVIGTGTAPYKSTAATADFAAVMAIASRCYAAYDKPLAARFLTAARSAFAWVQAHPDVVFRNPEGVSTGEYGDAHFEDERLWAAAELFRTTGEPAYDKAFRDSVPTPAAGKWSLTLRAPGWNDVASMAYWAYLFAPQGDAALKDAIREATARSAAELITRSSTSGYGNTLAFDDYVWGSNAVAANHALLLAIAHRIAPDSRAVHAALGNLDYLLGRNCHGVSWVTQLGTRPFLHPHHRPSAADGIAAPWPGLLSGGPNRHPADDAARHLPAAPPMRMWTDDQAAYSMNEVAINWNAPLVFLLAFANSLS